MIKKLIIFLLMANIAFAAPYLTVTTNQSAVEVNNKIKISGSSSANMDIGIELHDQEGVVCVLQRKSPYEINFIPSSTGNYTVYVSAGGITNSTTFSVSQTTTSSSTSSTTTTTSTTTSAAQQQTTSISTSTSSSSTTTTSSSTTTSTGDVNLTDSQKKTMKLNLTSASIKRVLEAELKEKINQIFGSSESVFTSRLSALGERLSSDMDISRSLVSGNTSNLTLSIKYKGNHTVKNLSIYEEIPKSFAQNASEITVNSNGEVVIVEEDPSFLILFESFQPQQEENITYSVQKKVDNISMNAPVMFAGAMEKLPVCGNGICETNETCEADCRSAAFSDFYWVIIIILIIIIALVIVYYVKPLSLKTTRKPKKKKYKYKR